MTSTNTNDAAHLAWRISTFSGGGGSCVEVAAEDDVVHVRNSNHRDAGTLHASDAAMADWVNAVKTGAFDDLAT